jgi:hypothetical protein
LLIFNEGITIGFAEREIFVLKYIISTRCAERMKDKRTERFALGRFKVWAKSMYITTSNDKSIFLILYKSNNHPQYYL